MEDENTAPVMDIKMPPPQPPAETPAEVPQDNKSESKVETKDEPAPLAKPKTPKADSVTGVIVMTVFIVIALAVLATFAYIQQNK